MQKIKILEIFSKIFFTLFCLTIFYGSFVCIEKDFYCFGHLIYSCVLFSFLIIAIVFEIIALLIQRKHKIPIKNPIKSFLKFLLVSFVFTFILSVIFSCPCVSREKAREAARKSDVKSIKLAQELFYKDKLIYAISQKELVDEGYLPKILVDILSKEEYTDKDGIGLEAGDKNSKTWMAYTIISGEKYRNEICSKEKPSEFLIFFCNEEGCGEKNINLTIKEQLKESEIIQLPTETENWKTYRNEEYNYEVKYPAEWTGGEKSLTVKVASFTPEERDMAQAGFWIYVYENSNELTSKQWWEQKYMKEDVNYSYENTFLISDIKAEVYKEKDGLEFIYYLFSKDSKIYFISSSLSKEKIQQILSTFKFINQEETETLDWKTYRNEEYGFEFDYPRNLNIKEKIEDVGFDSFSVFLESETSNGYLLFNNPGIAMGFDINISTENIIINGKNTELEILDSSIDNQRAAVVQFNKDKDEYFWLFRFDKKDDNKLFLAKNIFSSFKFIE